MPPARYMSDYGVMASSTKPPYTTLTAYDLNTGEIRWQVPNGDDPPTIAAGGPTNTGGLGARNGMVVTKAGLVFLAGGDGKVRALRRGHGKGAVDRAVRGQRRRACRCRTNQGASVHRHDREPWRRGSAGR